MRAFQTVSVVLFSTTAVVLATENSTYNLRPDNVTLSDLYKWVGSYYNGTTYVEFAPYAGLAASEFEYCPVFRNQTITTSYASVLSLTEPASYNSDDDVVNAFLTLWPDGFNFSSIPSEAFTEITEDSSLEYALFSSNPFYEYGDLAYNNFVWSLEETSAPPYNLSSTLTDYEGWNDFRVNRTVNCGGNIVTSWRFAPVSLNPSLNGTNFTNPVVDLQFDSTTANMTMKGYFFAVVQSEIGSDLESWYGNVFAGTFVLSFLGVVDSYHSDILRNDTATPTWIPTVGYNNNSLNVGYTNTTTSGGSRQTSSYGLAMLLLSSLQALAFFS